MSWKHDRFEKRDMLNVFDKKHLETFTYRFSSQHWDRVDGPEIDLVLNSYGFRSPEFEKLSSDNLNVLYLGCSFTFGDGLPSEYRWSDMLTKEIQSKSDKTVKHWNLGYDGNSVHLIIRNAMAFIRNYGKPDVIFAVLPDLSRAMHWYKDRYYIVHPPRDASFNEHWGAQQVDYAKKFTYEDEVMVAMDMLAMFEDFCEEAGIKFIYTSWDYDLMDIGQTQGYKINHFYDRELAFTYDDKKEKFDSLPENVDNLPYWGVAADGYHPGTCWNIWTKDKFMEKYEKN